MSTNINFLLAPKADAVKAGKAGSMGNAEHSLDFRSLFLCKTFKLLTKLRYKSFQNISESSKLPLQESSEKDVSKGLCRC